MSRRLTAAWGKAQWSKSEWGHARNAGSGGGGGGGTPVSIAFTCDLASTVLFKTKMRMGIKFEGDMASTALFATKVGAVDIECTSGGQTFTAAGLESSPLFDAPISH